jgi:hypothetical protein
VYQGFLAVWRRDSRRREQSRLLNHIKSEVIALITVKAGSHVYQLLQLLSVAGEFPTASLRLLGNERVVKALVHRLESPQDFRFPSGLVARHVKVFQVSGQRDRRTVRLCKEALPLLEELYPGALAYYLSAFHNHQFPGTADHVRRNHRVGEAVAVAMMAGLEFRPYALPKLKNSSIQRMVQDSTSYYICRDFKGNEIDDMSKTVFTRIVGAAFYPGGCYAVYNTRGAVMKWARMGEFKMSDHLGALVRRNAGLRDVKSMLLLGSDPMITLQTIMESDKRHAMRLDTIYHYVHYIPLDASGVRLLRILVLPNWKEGILSVLFRPDLRPTGHGSMEYDAIAGGVCVLSHLDSDLARLIRFRDGFRAETDKPFEVLCFPWQRTYLQEFLGKRATLRSIEMEALEHALFKT